jgi:hypothetical protein
LIAYFALRFADPYYFQSKNFFDPTISKVFIANVKSLKDMTVKDLNNWFPPMVQWLNKNTVYHATVNNVVFGIGIIASMFLVIGIANFSFSIFNKFSKTKTIKNPDLAAIFVWMIGFFLYQSLQTTPTLRYFIFLYPFFSLFSAIGIDFLLNLGKKILKSNLKFIILNSLFIILLLVWPVMFSSIYKNRHSRVEASEWIYKNLPNNSYILSEAWDDGLPLPMVDNQGKQFLGEQLPIFDPDTEQKWQKINSALARADYYILTSNRGWGSIPTVPKKYPKMSRFYEKLLTGYFCYESYCYRKIKEFVSYPQIKLKIFNYNFNLYFPDQWSDEAFTVYDHPKVMIYKNVKKL